MNPYFRNFECRHCAWFVQNLNAATGRSGVCRRASFGVTGFPEHKIGIGVVSAGDIACPAFVDNENTEFDEVKQSEEIGAHE